MTCSSRAREESQELSSHLESWVCKLEPMSSQMKLNIFPVSFFCYELAPNML